MNHRSFYSIETLKNINILENTLGYKLDSDIGILQTRHFIRPDDDIIFDIIKGLDKQKLNELSCLFLYILCSTKIIPFNSDWLSTQEFLSPYLNKIKRESKKSKKINNDIGTFYIKGLSYKGNSCYMDSTLFSLFFNNHPIIDYYLLETKQTETCSKSIQENLTTISLFIRNQLDDKKDEMTCMNLRKALKDCDDLPQPFNRTNTQDAGEFLLYLFNKFNLTIATQYQYTYASNDNEKYIEISRRELKTDPVIQILSTELVNMSDDTEYSLCHFIKKTDIAELDPQNLYKKDGKTYKYRKQITKLLAPFIVFRIQRLGYDDEGEETFFKTKLVPSKVLFMPNEKQKTIYSTLTLQSIVIHHESFAHYSCLFNKNDTWYHYNDLKGIKKIGSYEKMLKMDPNPVSHGILYFYM